MFQGTLPHKAIKIIGNIVKEWSCNRIYIGCSGNFTIERSISELVACPITSNDVTIYSSNIGKYFAGEELGELKIKDDYNGDCIFLKDYMNNDTEKVATMILASDILPYSNEYANNKYAERMLKGYKEQYSRMHAQLCKKLEEMKTRIDSFYHGDVMKMLDEIPKNCGFISFPPFFKGGYEKMWEKIENFFEYTEPEYEMFDPDVHIKLFCEKVSRLDNFCIGTERPVDELEKHFNGVVETGKGKVIYMYSKTKRTHYIKSDFSQKIYGQPIVKIDKNDKVTNNIIIKRLSAGQFQEVRALYLGTAVTKTTDSRATSLAIGLFNQDGKLFGVLAFSNSFMLTGSEKLERPTIYLIADFAVSPTCEKNLSKLVLYCALSKEVQFLVQGVTGKRANTLATNAFSKNPVSMKYRGLFEQFGRRELEKDENGKVIKYNLSYGTRMGQWTLKEGYELWRQKLSK